MPASVVREQRSASRPYVGVVFVETLTTSHILFRNICCSDSSLPPKQVGGLLVLSADGEAADSDVCKSADEAR